MTDTAGFAERDVGVVDVADLTDGGVAVHADLAHFAGRHADGRESALLRHELRGVARGADELRTLARVHFDVVDNGTHGDVRQRQSVARLDVGALAGNDHITGGETDRSENVAALAVGILDQRDVGAAVGVVLQAEDLRLDVALVALEVDDAVLLPVAAAVMANGDAAVVVAAGVLLLDLDQGLLRGGMLVDPIKAGNGHVPAGGGHRTVGFNRHSLSLP